MDSILDTKGKHAGKEFTVKQILVAAIPALAAAYNRTLAAKQAEGKKAGKFPTKGAHARQLNGVLRAVFPKLDPRQVTEAAVAAKVIAQRDGVKGGPMFYLPADADTWTSNNAMVSDILAAL